MQLNWMKAQSKEPPKLVDEKSSLVGVYIRQNVVYEDEMYNYEEAFLTKEDYQIYKMVTAIELKHDDDVVDDYTLKLIEEGIL